MNFQEICRELGDRCEVTGYDSIVPGQSTGEAGRVVKWARDAWVRIQQEHEWRFLRTDLSFLTQIGVATYSPAIVQAANKPLRFIDFDTLRCYLESIGKSDEQILVELEWDEWNDLYNFGTPPSGRPAHAALVASSNSLIISPVPDAIYRVTGTYWRQAQVLTAADDIPIVDDELHMAIVYRGMLTYANREGANDVRAEAESNLEDLMAIMRRRYLSSGERRGPLA